DLPFWRSQHGFLGHAFGGWELSGTHRYQTGVAVTPAQQTNNTDPYCDLAFNNNFIGATLDSCRPLLSNANAPFNTVGRYLNATQLINVSSCQSTAQVGTPTCPVISPSSVHFIINNTFAVNALCGGNPFACSVGRNVTRTEPRNQVDFSLQKNFRITERLSFTARGDVLNAFNYQFYGVPGLNANLKNASGVGAGGAPAPNTFGEIFNSVGTNRAIIVSGHITF